MLRVGGRCVPGGGRLRRLLPAAELHCFLVLALWHLVSTSWIPWSSSSWAVSLAGASVLFKIFVLFVVFVLDFVLAMRRSAVGERAFGRGCGDPLRGRRGCLPLSAVRGA